MDSNLQLAIVAAIKAGKEILTVYKQETEVEYKADNSPLTLADKRSHIAIVECLMDSQLPVLSEEGREIPFAERSGWKSFWLIDPLDGTKEFIKRNGEFTVNIALIANNKPVLGVVFVPVTNVLYFASESAGSFKTIVKDDFTPENMEELLRTAIPLSKQKYPDIYTIVASRSHSTTETIDFIEKKEQEHGRINSISAGSSIKLCLVAEHQAHIYPRLAPTMEWDTAAGHAIAKFSGCRVFDYQTGEELRYNKENLLNPWFVVDSAN